MTATPTTTRTPRGTAEVNRADLNDAIEAIHVYCPTDAFASLRLRLVKALSTERSGRRDLAERVREACAEVPSNCCGACCDQIRALDLSPLIGEEKDGWRDIATAPKDGIAVILGWTTAAMIAPALWRNGEWRAWGEWGSQSKYISPTHWQPLPAPPATEETP